MTASNSNALPRIPKGFDAILKGIAREVLQNQPDDIFKFGATYFEQCLRVRNASRVREKYESNQIKYFDTCIFHSDRDNFNDISLELELSKIIPKAYIHRLPMAVCSCKRRKVNLHELMTAENLKKRITDLQGKMGAETTWSEKLKNYLSNIIIDHEDISLKQDSKCRLIYIIHQALFPKNFDMLTRASVAAISRTDFMKMRSVTIVANESKVSTSIENKLVSSNDQSNEHTARDNVFITALTEDEKDEAGESVMINVSKARSNKFPSSNRLRITTAPMGAEDSFKKQQDKSLKTHDVIADSPCLATDLKEDLRDMYELKAFSEQKRKASNQQKVPKYILEDGHCRYCYTKFQGFKSDVMSGPCIYHHGYIVNTTSRNMSSWKCCKEKALKNKSYSLAEDHSKTGCHARERHKFTPNKKYHKQSKYSRKNNHIFDDAYKLVQQTSHNSSQDVLYLSLDQCFI